MRPAVGAELSLEVAGAGLLTGRLAEVGAEWLLIEERPGQDTLVPLAAVLALAGLGPRSVEPGGEGRVFARLGLAAALRGLTRDRRPVTVCLVGGGTATGTVDRVGRDFFEVAEHPAGEPRRRSAVQGWRLVTFAGLAAVRSA